jgi:hypothetical protein
MQLFAWCRTVVVAGTVVANSRNIDSIDNIVGTIVALIIELNLVFASLLPVPESFVGCNRN